VAAGIVAGALAEKRALAAFAVVMTSAIAAMPAGPPRLARPLLWRQTLSQPQGKPWTRS
jgi:hypothetical protein